MNAISQFVVPVGSRRECVPQRSIPGSYVGKRTINLARPIDFNSVSHRLGHEGVTGHYSCAKGRVCYHPRFDGFCEVDGFAQHERRGTEFFTGEFMVCQAHQFTRLLRLTTQAVELVEQMVVVISGGTDRCIPCDM